MKKVILIVAVVVVALVGLTSYSRNNVKKENGSDDRLLAMIKTSKSGTPIIVGGDGKKKD